MKLVLTILASLIVSSAATAEVKSFTCHKVGPHKYKNPVDLEVKVDTTTGQFNVRVDGDNGTSRRIFYVDGVATSKGSKMKFKGFSNGFLMTVFKNKKANDGGFRAEMQANTGYNSRTKRKERYNSNLNCYF